MFVYLMGVMLGSEILIWIFILVGEKGLDGWIWLNSYLSWCDGYYGGGFFCYNIWFCFICIMILVLEVIMILFNMKGYVFYLIIKMLNL